MEQIDTSEYTQKDASTNLNSLTVHQLRGIAKDFGLVNYSKNKKTELINAIRMIMFK